MKKNIFEQCSIFGLGIKHRLGGGSSTKSHFWGGGGGGGYQFLYSIPSTFCNFKDALGTYSMLSHL